MNHYRIDHVRLKPDKQIDRHEQETWELSYVVTGSGEREVGGIRAPFGPGDLVLVPPGIPHVWHFRPEDVDSGDCIENVSLIFDDDFLRGVREVFPALDGVVERILAYTDAIEFPSSGRTRLSTLLHRLCRESAEEQTATLLSLLIDVSAGGRPVGHYVKTDIAARRLEQVCIYVTCNYVRPITLDEVARHVGMNRSAFSTFFRRHTGQTFVHYLNSYRIEKARRLLSQSEMSIGEVCFATGFNDVAYFCRTFRRYTGQAPSYIRKGKSAATNRQSPSTE